MSGVETVLAVAGGLAIAAAVVGGAGAVAQGNSRKAAAEYNEGLAKQQAEVSVAQANQTEVRQRYAASKVASAQHAAIGKSGVALEGSALLALEDTAVNAEIDALTTRYEGRLAADRATSQAKLDDLQGREAKTAGYYGAAGSLLGGGSKAFALGGGGGRSGSGLNRTPGGVD